MSATTCSILLIYLPRVHFRWDVPYIFSYDKLRCIFIAKSIWIYDFFYSMELALKLPYKPLHFNACICKHIIWVPCFTDLEVTRSSCNWSCFGLMLPWWTSIECCNLHIQGKCCPFSSYDHVSLVICLPKKLFGTFLIYLASIHLHLSWVSLYIRL